MTAAEPPEQRAAREVAPRFGAPCFPSRCLMFSRHARPGALPHYVPQRACVFLQRRCNVRAAGSPVPVAHIACAAGPVAGQRSSPAQAVGPRRAIISANSAGIRFSAGRCRSMSPLPERGERVAIERHGQRGRTPVGLEADMQHVGRPFLDRSVMGPRCRMQSIGASVVPTRRHAPRHAAC